MKNPRRRTVRAREARSRWGNLLDRVEQGEDIVITRRGRPIARLVPIRRGFDTERVRRALDDIEARVRGRSLGNISIRRLIEDGRRY